MRLVLDADALILKLVSDGRLSIGRAAELLDVTYYDLYAAAQSRDVELGASDEQREKSRVTAARLGQHEL